MQKVTDNIFLLVLFAMMGTFLLAAAFIFFFLKYQRRIALQKEAMQMAAIAYSEQLLNATLVSQEEERRRIGRDLHDDVGASLSNLKMIMAQTVAAGQPEYKPLIDKIITTVRNISHTLSPPGLELFGLENTLHELFDSFTIGGVIKIDFQNELGKQLDQSDHQTSLALYRILQELLSNTVKHADAKNILVRFFAENNYTILNYHDDGRGMSNSTEIKNGMGMQNVQARLQMIQATSAVTTAPGEGFSITISVPQKTTVTV